MRRRLVFGLILIPLLVLVTAGCYVLLHRSPKHGTQLNTQKTLPAAKPKAEQLQTSMLYVGEVFWGRGIEYYSKKSPLGTAFPFSGLTAQDRADFDAWIGDMECPVTSKDVPYQTQVDILKFNCRPEYVPEAAKWFTALTLANNHTDNNDGEWGIDQTRKNLGANHIQYFGDYNMRHLADICDVIAMPARYIKDQSMPQTVSMPVALCGYDYVGNVSPMQDEYEVMKKYAAVMPVIAMPHMGVEYRPTAEEAKVTTYHALIDNGADVVIGAHPHVIQNGENYKGRLIQYSTGNFMFDQQSLGRDTILSLGVGLDLTIKDKSAVEAYRAAANCEVYHDDCLSQLSSKITKRPVIYVKYSSRCFEQSSNIPKKADQATCEDILKRATWQTATADLSLTW